MTRGLCVGVAAQSVAVTFNGVKSEGVVGADGTFSVTLPASPASTTPGILTVSSPVSPTVTLTDVVVGDVILCSVRVCGRVCAFC